VARLKTKHKTTLVTHGGNWGTHNQARKIFVLSCSFHSHCVYVSLLQSGSASVSVSVSVSVCVRVCVCCACWETCGVSHFSSFLRTAGFQDGLSPTRVCGYIYCSVFSLPQRRELGIIWDDYNADLAVDVSLEYWLYKLDCLHMRRREK
jgi:hypothetical protein